MRADRIVTGQSAWTPGWIAISDGRILDCGEGEPPGERSDLDAEHVTGTVIPGFVDIHAHGAGGFDFGSADEDSARRIAGFHATRGTTSLVASLASAPLDSLEQSIRTLRPLVENGTLAGIHLEGPYLSPQRRGAHDQAMLRSPSMGEIARLVGAGAGAVRMVTIAPELAGAEATVRWLVSNGVTVALGHTDCDAETAREAFGWGASVVTHLFNGMRPLHHRAPGLVGVALVDDRVTIELILDGHHVGAEAAEVARRSAPNRLALVSDAMSATGCGDGDFEIGGSAVRVTGGVAMLADGTSLAGSTTTLADGFDRVLSFPGMTVSEAVRLTSTAASRAIALGQSGIQPGASANLVVLDVASEDESGLSARVSRVMRGGSWLG
ncbi:N-acetylglucosamine-6-phosphate deacetylase [Lacisediminihabitans profunda]|uniref:N-acetylglucosamine-6-phosphate deacetylase n=1 Tax=Lacisediminihabitans profunda TaxID=2594790 RepID=UPI00164FFFA4|nr:N-acetylglucosamine-6-phosphate deacetylase [Lacisediminihabitans profunda]